MRNNRGFHLDIDQVLLNRLPEQGLSFQSEGSYQVNAHSEQFLKIAMNIDNLPANRSLELYEDIDIALFRWFATCPRAENGNPPNVEPLLQFLLVFCQ